MSAKKLQTLRRFQKKTFAKITKKNLPFVLLTLLVIAAVPAVAVSQISLSRTATTKNEEKATTTALKDDATTKTTVTVTDSVDSTSDTPTSTTSTETNTTPPKKDAQTPKKSGGTSSSSSPKMSPENNYPTQPSHPKPKFSISLSQPSSNNAFGFIIDVHPDPTDQNVDYKWPTVAYGANGSPQCGGEIYLTGGFRQWGWNCNLYYNAQYGEFPVTFTVQATNGYGQSSTASVTGVVVYRPDQVNYENRF